VSEQQHECQAVEECDCQSVHPLRNVPNREPETRNDQISVQR
jgi:hypothetical protein